MHVTCELPIGLGSYDAQMILKPDLNVTTKEKRPRTLFLCFIYLCVSLFDIFILKVFRGNRDGNTVMKHYLKEKLVAKTLRILRHQNSKDFMGSTVCLRAEVYGCEFQTGEWMLSRDKLLLLETDRRCKSQITVICFTFSLSSYSRRVVS